jgi:hypothetical protein
VGFGGDFSGRGYQLVEVVATVFPECTAWALLSTSLLAPVDAAREFLLPSHTDSHVD